VGHPQNITALWFNSTAKFNTSFTRYPTMGFFPEKRKASNRMSAVMHCGIGAFIAF
jgi:hypothetical protein